MELKKVFWPMLFILAGAVIIINTIFNFNIRLSRLIFAVILIYIGFSIISGKKNEKTSAVFSETKANSDKSRNYSLVFGSGDVDLTDIYLNGENINVKADIVFGTGRVKLKGSTPAVIKMESYFASTSYMGDNIVFGEKTVRTPSYIDGQPYLNLRVSTVFGSVFIDIVD
ncbi:MAG: hypothetical protein WCQ54_09055 [Clostridiaceae bacterium]